MIRLKPSAKGKLVFLLCHLTFHQHEMHRREKRILNHSQRKEKTFYPRVGMFIFFRDCIKPSNARSEIFSRKSGFTSATLFTDQFNNFQCYYATLSGINYTIISCTLQAFIVTLIHDSLINFSTKFFLWTFQKHLELKFLLSNEILFLMNSFYTTHATTGKKSNWLAQQLVINCFLASLFRVQIEDFWWIKAENKFHMKRRWRKSSAVPLPMRRLAIGKLEL